MVKGLRGAVWSSRCVRAVVDLSWDVTALPGWSTHVVYDLRSLPVMAVGPEMQLQVGWEYHGLLAMQHPLTHVKVVQCAMRAALRDLLPHLSWEDQGSDWHVVVSVFWKASTFTLLTVLFNRGFKYYSRTSEWHQIISWGKNYSQKSNLEGVQPSAFKL